jgi:hypothetical protein
VLGLLLKAEAEHMATKLSASPHDDDIDTLLDVLGMRKLAQWACEYQPMCLVVAADRNITF